MTVDHPHRAIDAPFAQPAEWKPIPGACSRCGQRAWLGERRWWHQGPACRLPSTVRPVPAEFIPDHPTLTRKEK